MSKSLFGETSGNYNDKGYFRQTLNFVANNYASIIKNFNRSSTLNSKLFEKKFQKVHGDSNLRDDQKLFFIWINLVSGAVKLSELSEKDFKRLFDKLPPVSNARWLGTSILALIAFSLSTFLIDFITDPFHLVMEFYEDSWDKLEEFITFLVQFYCVSWDRVLKNSDMPSGVLNLFFFYQTASKIDNETLMTCIYDLLDANHYFLTADQIPLLLAHSNKTVRVETADKLIELSSELSSNFIAPKLRKFDQGDLFVHHESVYSYLSIESFSCPLFSGYTKNKILSTLYNIKDGEDPYNQYRNFKNNSRSVERAVRVMVEAHDAAKSSTNQNNWARSVYEDRIKDPKPWLLKSSEVEFD